MKSPNLQEATIQDICDELSKRNINFVLVANYYDAPEEEQQPIISFGVKKHDLTKSIGMMETAKFYLIGEFHEDSDITYKREKPNDDDDDEDETPF